MSTIESTPHRSSWSWFGMARDMVQAGSIVTPGWEGRVEPAGELNTQARTRCSATYCQPHARVGG
ncbi:MAG: hypothetical protein AB7U73_07135 [Pirellulales bacterium]